MKPNKERLLKVIESVERRPEELFDMSVFAINRDCGTVACAAGSYIIDNPNCGLHLEWTLPSRSANVRDGNPNHHSFEALAFHFDITEDSAIYLFEPDSYKNNRPAKATVLARFRAFVAAIAD